MYRDLPLRHRIMVRTVLGGAWIISALGGYGLLFTPHRPGVPDPLWVGPVLILSTLTAAFGVITNRYRFEWVASWIAAGAVAPYAGAVAWAQIGNYPRGFAVVSLLVSLLLFYVYRAIACSIHAQRLRMEQTGG